MEKHAEAEQLYSQAIELLAKAISPNQRYYATAAKPMAKGLIIYRDLAELYLNVSKLSEAENLHLQTIERLERDIGALNPNIGTIRTRLAEFYWDTERYAEADAQFKLARELFAVTLGPTHDDVSCCVTSRSYLLQELELHDEALALAEEWEALKSS